MPEGTKKGAPKLPDLKNAMAKILGEDKQGLSALEAIILAQRSKAAKGDTKAADFLFKYGYGMPSQRIEMNIKKLGKELSNEDYI